MAGKPTKKRKAPAKKKAPARKRTPAKKAVKRSATASATASAKATPAALSDKQHLVDVIQAGTGSTKKAAQETLNAVLATVTASLKKNKRFQLVGFGTFDVAKRRARMGRNPATGEKIRIKASRRVRFRAGAELKSSI